MDFTVIRPASDAAKMVVWLLEGGVTNGRDGDILFCLPFPPCHLSHFSRPHTPLFLRSSTHVLLLD